jgi:dTDP-4-dehydrorhamnose 3,5-epimerase
MNFKRFKIDGPVLIEPKVFGDERGFFFESFKASLCKSEGIPTDFLQDNHSRSSKSVLRGMHFQIPPFPQGKMVRVIRGGVVDVVIDIRKNSKSFGEWMSVELNEENKSIFYVPPGFAHGFLTLQDETDFLYKVTTEYSPTHELGIHPLDSDMKIPWKDWLQEEFILSQKDKDSPKLRDFISPFTI